ncbi:chromo domain-containing protein [Fusarium denticulatum]|uniref:Chromo domain-containing protein n=1 Tax=Fusarium denticulatum TaxID=48507 RepID=A0A8H5X6H3_9HYPO|nr:chromo domain-containing protein [Fusarium denticulatum]
MNRKRPAADRITSERGKTAKRGRVSPDKTGPAHATAEVPEDPTDAPAANEDNTVDEDVDQDPDTSQASTPAPDLHKNKTLETATSDLEDEADAPTASQDGIPEEMTNEEPDASDSGATEPDSDENTVFHKNASRVDDETESPMPSQDKASEVATSLLDLAGVDLAEDLRSITKYAIDGEFFLYCHLRNGRSGWVAEERVQTETPLTLNTFWESREDGVGRPHTKVDEKVFKVVPQRREQKEKCVVWLVGEPYFTATREIRIYFDVYMKRWKPHFRLPKIITVSEAERLYPKTSTTWCDETASNVRQMIFSHRKNPFYEQPEFEFFIHYDSREGKWEREANIQKKYPAAVETYWQSHPGLREEQSLKDVKVPEQCLKIHGHSSRGGKTILQVQLVGKFDCEELEASRALKKWKKPVIKYLKRHSLKA